MLGVTLGTLVDEVIDSILRTSENFISKVISVARLFLRHFCTTFAASTDIRIFVQKFEKKSFFPNAKLSESTRGAKWTIIVVVRARK